MLFGLAALWSAAASAGGTPVGLQLGRDLPYAVWIDPGGTRTIDEVARLPATAFRPVADGLALSYTHAAAWLRFDLPAAAADGGWWLEIQPALLDSIQLFEPGPTGWRLREAGDRLPYHSRELPHRFFLFALSPDPAAGPTTRFLRVQNSGSLYLLATLRSPPSTIVASARSNLQWGLYFGAMTVVLLFLVAMVAINRNRAYQALAAALLLNTVHVANSQGFLAASLWADWPGWADRSVGFTAPWAIASMGWALREFLTRTQAPRWLDRSYLLASAACLLIPLTLWTGGYGLAMRLGMLWVLAAMLGGLILLARRRPFGRFERVMTASLLLLLAGALATILPLLGLLPASGELLLLRNALFIVFAVMASLALLWDIRATYLGMLAEQSRALRFSLEHEQLLETRVAERTQALAEANAALARSQRHYRMLTESMKDVVWVLDVDSLRFLYVSPSVQALRGYTPEEVMAEPMDAALEPAAARQVRRLIAERVAALLSGRISSETFFTNEVAQPCKDGGTVWTEVITYYWLNRETGKVELHGVTRDIGERKRAEEQIRNLAYFDALTGLPNRRLLEDRLAQAQARSVRNREYGALIFLDLDNFKPLNDRHGHAAGDLLLAEVARRLRGQLRQEDTVARLGGDEFVIVLDGLGKAPAAATARAGELAEKIRAALAEPYRLVPDPDDPHANVLAHRCTSSLGVVLFLGEGIGPVALMQQADAAMYQAKAAGRNTIHCEPAPADPPAAGRPG